jgi:hypothetical protein
MYLFILDRKLFDFRDQKILHLFLQIGFLKKKMFLYVICIDLDVVDGEAMEEFN